MIWGLYVDVRLDGAWWCQGDINQFIIIYIYIYIYMYIYIQRERERERERAERKKTAKHSLTQREKEKYTEIDR